jgi:hypothetical protein
VTISGYILFILAAYLVEAFSYIVKEGGSDQWPTLQNPQNAVQWKKRG